MDPLTYAAIAGLQMGLQAYQGQKERKAKAMAETAEGKLGMGQARRSQQQEQIQTALGDLISSYRGSMGGGK
jgi:hypothetical protein